MLSELEPIPVQALALGSFEELLERAVEMARESIAPATRRAYASDWRAFVAWAERLGIEPSVPVEPKTCAAWVADMDRSGLALATIRRRLRALSFVHRSREVESPTADRRVRSVLQGLARTRAGRPPRRKRALSPSMVRVAAEHLGTRDLAIVLVAFVTGMRRSELAALTWADLEDVDEGLIAWVRVSKTDQEGHGAPVAVPRSGGPRCPVAALTRLRIEREAAADDRVFGVGPDTINKTIKRVAALAGEDPRQFGAHSARAGFMTTARMSASLADIMAQSRHRTVGVAMGYIRPGEAAKNPAAHAVARSIK